MAARLVETRIRNARKADKPYKLTDGNGLYLLVHPNGSRYWRYRYRLKGAESVFALGQYPEVSLKQAREARDAAKRVVKSGTSPTQQRKDAVAAAAITAAMEEAEAAANAFELVANEWMRKNVPHWSAYYARQVQTVLGSDVFPSIGTLALNAVTSKDILAIVERVAERGAPAVATLIRQWCSAIFRYGASTLRCSHDPAAAVKGAVRRPKVKHKKALPPKELSRLSNRISSMPMTPVSVALQLLMLTFVRPGELRSAAWSEFDWDVQEWRIPAIRMKMREEHVVPLSRQVLALLHQLQQLQSPGAQILLFPNSRDPRRPMSPTTLNRALERMGWAGRFSAHGFRATASTILNEAGYRPDVIERQLAHRERSKVRASYNHATYMVERRTMMQDWADFIAPAAPDENQLLVATVVDQKLAAGPLLLPHDERPLLSRRHQ